MRASLLVIQEIVHIIDDCEMCPHPSPFIHSCLPACGHVPDETLARSVATAQPRLAVRRSLAGRPLHDLGRRSLGIPLLDPAADDLPFACFLELHRAPTSSQTVSSSPSMGPEVSEPPDIEVLEMIYVLEGNGQVRGKLLRVVEQRLYCHTWVEDPPQGLTVN